MTLQEPLDRQAEAGVELRVRWLGNQTCEDDASGPPGNAIITSVAIGLGGVFHGWRTVGQTPLIVDHSPVPPFLLQRRISERGR